jgi:hypothetical protein
VGKRPILTCTHVRSEPLGGQVSAHNAVRRRPELRIKVDLSRRAKHFASIAKQLAPVLRPETVAALVQMPARTRSIQNFLKHSPKWNIFTLPQSTTSLLPSGCTSML